MQHTIQITIVRDEDEIESTREYADVVAREIFFDEGTASVEVTITEAPPESRKLSKGGA